MVGRDDRAADRTRRRRLGRSPVTVVVVPWGAVVVVDGAVVGLVEVVVVDPVAPVVVVDEEPAVVVLAVLEVVGPVEVVS